MARGTAEVTRLPAVGEGRCGSGGNGPTVMQGPRLSRIGRQQEQGPQFRTEEESRSAVRGRDESGRPD